MVQLKGGADVVAVFERDNDVIGRQFILFIQAKVGKIDLSQWRKIYVHKCLSFTIDLQKQQRPIHLLCAEYF